MIRLLVHNFCMQSHQTVRKKKTGEEESMTQDARVSLDWTPTDKSGRLNNFFDKVKAVPDMRKVCLGVRNADCWNSHFERAMRSLPLVVFMLSRKL